MPKPAVTLAEKILPSIPNNGLDLQQLKISEIYNLNRENRGFFNFNFFLPLEISLQRITEVSAIGPLFQLKACNETCIHTTESMFPSEALEETLPQMHFT